MKLTLSIDKTKITEALHQVTGMLAKRTQNFDIDAITDDESAFVNILIEDSLNNLCSAIYRKSPNRTGMSIELTIRGDFDILLVPYLSEMATSCVQEDVLSKATAQTHTETSGFYLTRSANSLDKLLKTLTKRKMV